MSEKKIKIYFKRSPKGYAYFAGETVELPARQAKEFVNSGVASYPTETLPKDLPGREAFVAAGIETLAEIRELDDPTSVKDVGDATAKELAEWLAANA